MQFIKGFTGAYNFRGYNPCSLYQGACNSVQTVAKSSLFVSFFSSPETKFLYIALSVLELSLYTRLALNSDIHLPLSSEYWVKGVYYNLLAGTLGFFFFFPLISLIIHFTSQLQPPLLVPPLQPLTISPSSPPLIRARPSPRCSPCPGTSSHCRTGRIHRARQSAQVREWDSQAGTRFRDSPCFSCWGMELTQASGRKTGMIWALKP